MSYRVLAQRQAIMMCPCAIWKAHALRRHSRPRQLPKLAQPLPPKRELQLEQPRNQQRPLRKRLLEKVHRQRALEQVTQQQQQRLFGLVLLL